MPARRRQKRGGHPADGERGITVGRTAYCDGGAFKPRPPIDPIGITGGTLADPVAGAAPAADPARPPAGWPTPPAGGAAVHACGTDNGPIEIAWPIPADTAGPPEPGLAGEPTAPSNELNPPAKADSPALTLEAAVVVVDPRDFAMEFSELTLVIGVFARYAAVRTGVDRLLRLFTADISDVDEVDEPGEVRLCNACGTAEVNRVKAVWVSVALDVLAVCASAAPWLASPAGLTVIGGEVKALTFDATAALPA